MKSDKLQNPLLFDLVDERADYQNKVALKRITLRIRQGEKIALMDPSGAGKTTLLRLLYERSQLPLNGYQNVLNEVAYVDQHYALVSQLSVLHNVYMGRLDRNSTFFNLRNLIRPQKTVLTEIELILTDLNMEQQINQTTGTLSGGQKQRTAIARAMYKGGNLLLADEPISSIDVQQAGAILDLLCQNAETIVMSLHNVDFAMKYAQRIIGLRQGEILFDQPTSHVTLTMLDTLYNP